jgi:hypothetical protein
MTYSAVPLINGLLVDTDKYLASLNITISKNEKDLLKRTLKHEFTKSMYLQKNTPTQLVNNFLLDNYELSEKLTPRSFSEETFLLIMQWGLHKASKVSNKSE